MKSTGYTVTGVGGDTQVIGTIVGTVNIGGAKFDGVRFDIVERITSEVKCILGLNIFSHPKVHNLNLDIKNQVITFVLKGDRDVLESKIVEYSFEKNGQRASVTVKPIVNPIEMLSKSLRDKLEYLKSEQNIELCNDNRDYTEHFANLLIEHKNALSDGTSKSHIKSERVGV